MKRKTRTISKNPVIKQNRLRAPQIHMISSDRNTHIPGCANPESHNSQ